MIADAISLCAYAKINIHLKVLSKRYDGFHGIESIFQRISIADYISVVKIPEMVDCCVESPLLDLPYKNTIRLMWEVFTEAVSVNQGVTVRIVKNIPPGTGLGAGSSNAAAFLYALNRLFNAELTPSQMKVLALRVGSDVPFFLTEGASIVRGRGECFEPLHVRTDCFGLLICPGVFSSTKTAYSLLDEARLKFEIQDECWGAERLKKHYQSPIKDWVFENDFQPVVQEVFPVIAEAVSDMYGYGSVFARMSGSGSAVFGLFETESDMHRAFFALSKKWQWCKPFVLLV